MAGGFDVPLFLLGGLQSSKNVLLMNHDGVYVLLMSLNNDVAGLLYAVRLMEGGPAIRHPWTRKCTMPDLCRT